MWEAPDDVIQRRDAFSAFQHLSVRDLRGFGLDGYIWQTSGNTILKVFRQNRRNEFARELAVYLKLRQRKTRKLRGFWVPALLHYDEELLVMELSYVEPPFILDFAEATLDRPPARFDLDSPEFAKELQSLYGPKAPDVRLLLDALRQMGIYYPDVHRGNIRVEPPNR